MFGKQLEIRSMPATMETRNTLVAEAEELVAKAKKERRNLTTAEKTKFESVQKQIEKIDEDINSADNSKVEMRQIKTAGKAENSPYEVRGYSKGENIGKGNSNVTIGDLIYSHITGKFRNSEVRTSLSTTSGGLVIPTEIYKDFIDRLRNQSVINECTFYPMNTQTLLIPRVKTDPTPNFKLENDLIVESDPIFDSLQLKAKPLYVMTSVSLELIESSNLNVGDVISRVLAGAMKSTMQNAMINGGMTNGYAGIKNDANINKVTVTAPLDYAEVSAGIQAVQSANGTPTALVANANTLMGLATAKDTTGQYIVSPSFMDGITRYNVGTDLADNTALVGDLSAIAFGVLSEGGLQIELDKSGEAFQRGQVKIRCRINADFALTNPKLMTWIA